MNTTIEEHEDKFLVTFDGELDTAAAAQASEMLQPLYAASGKDVVIDCSKLEYIAYSGLRILVSVVKGAKAGGSKVVLRHVDDEILDVLRMTGFTTLFQIED